MLPAWLVNEMAEWLSHPTYCRFKSWPNHIFTHFLSSIRWFLFPTKTSKAKRQMVSCCTTRPFFVQIIWMFFLPENNSWKKFLCFYRLTRIKFQSVEKGPRLLHGAIKSVHFSTKGDFVWLFIDMFIKWRRAWWECGGNPLITLYTHLSTKRSVLSNPLLPEGLVKFAYKQKITQMRKILFSNTKFDPRTLKTVKWIAAVSSLFVSRFWFRRIKPLL